MTSAQSAFTLGNCLTYQTFSSKTSGFRHFEHKTLLTYSMKAMVLAPALVGASQPCFPLSLCLCTFATTYICCSSTLFTFAFQSFHIRSASHFDFDSRSFANTPFHKSNICLPFLPLSPQAQLHLISFCITHLSLPVCLCFFLCWLCPVSVSLLNLT